MNWKILGVFILVIGWAVAPRGRNAGGRNDGWRQPDLNAWIKPVQDGTGSTGLSQRIRFTGLSETTNHDVPGRTQECAS